MFDCISILATVLRVLTSEVHPGLEALAHAARRAVFPSDLVDDAVVPPGAKVVVLA